MIILSQAVWLQYPVCVLSPGVRIPVSRAQAEVWCLQCHRFMWSDVIFMWRQHERMLPTPSKPRSRIPICNNSFMTKYQNSADSPDYKTYHTLDEDAENTYDLPMIHHIILPDRQSAQISWIGLNGLRWWTRKIPRRISYLDLISFPVLRGGVLLYWVVVSCWRGHKNVRDLSGQFNNSDIPFIKNIWEKFHWSRVDKSI